MTVHYQPDKPAVAALETELPPIMQTYLVWGGAGGGLALAMLIALRRDWMTRMGRLLFRQQTV